MMDSDATLPYTSALMRTDQALLKDENWDMPRI